MHNNGEILKVNGSVIPYAYRGDIHMAVQSSCGFSRGSAGFVAYSDGWTDISRNLNMDYEFTSATDGNIALTAELPQQDQYDFTVAVAFGDSRNNAILKAMQAASTRNSGGIHHLPAEKLQEISAHSQQFPYPLQPLQP